CIVDRWNTPSAVQYFEYGMMVWVEAFDTVILMKNNGEYWYYIDTYEGGAQELTTPPPGYYPARYGFGAVWENDFVAREALGWGVGPEISYQGFVESTVPLVQNGQLTFQGLLFLTLPNGARVQVDMASASWTYMD
ncbi:MAG: hypothetical protein AAF125_23600, partial [Chloroflexota bacterium]